MNYDSQTKVLPTVEKINLELEFTEEQSMIMEASREFCRKNSDTSTVRSLIPSNLGFDKDIWAKMVDLGWTGITIPEKFGGSGLGIGALVPVVESMGRYLLTAPVITSAIAIQAILLCGTHEFQTDWLPRLADGSIGTLAFLENEDLASDATLIAVSRGSKVELQGRKILVVDAGAADFFLVSALFNDKPVLVLVESDQLSTDSISNKTLIDETNRAADIDFSGVVVDPQAVLSATHKSIKDLRLLGALLYAAESTGACAAALDTIVNYLTTRTQFGRLIGSYQALKHPTTDILIQMDSAKSLVYHAATLATNFNFCTHTEIACRMAKVQANDALLFAGDRAVQFHGGMGFTYDCDAQLYIRRAQWAQHQFGDSQHHRFHLAPLLIEDI